MKLSVIIPVYNGAEFIQKSYHSILNQQIEDFEILYVDNNSVDASIEEIKKVIEADGRVTLFKQTKQGAGAARNLGINKANGDYLYVFDVDDEIYPDALKKMIAVLDKNPTLDAVFGKMVKSHQGISQTKKPNNETNKITIKEKPFWGIHWFSDLSTVVGPPAFLYRKSVFTIIGNYNEEIEPGEDTAFDIKLGMTSNIAFLDSYVYLYYKHSNSIIEQSKQKTSRAFMIWPRLVKEHLSFYIKNVVPLRYKKILFEQLYKSMGKQLYFTKPFSKRKFLKQKLLNEMHLVKVPFIIKFYLSILVVFPFSYIIKFFGYYLVPFIVKQLK